MNVRRLLPLLAVVVLATACGSGAEVPAGDLVLTNGIVITPRGTVADGSVAIRAGRILAAGATADVARHRRAGTRVIDLAGAVVAPAFVDHHVHLLNVGLSLLNRERDDALYIDLSGMDAGAIAASLGRRAADAPAGAWPLGKGWSQYAFDPVAMPDRATLDAAVPGHPVYLSRVDGHAGWASTAALEAAGIGDDAADPPGGALLRRPDGTPTGVLLERANEAVLSLVPRPSPGDLQAAFTMAAEALAAQGVVEVFEAGFLTPPGVVDLEDDLEPYLAALVAADAAAPLPVRVNLMIPAPSSLAEAVLADPGAYREITPRIRTTHVKLFADGAMGSRGASLSHDFADDPGNNGVARMSTEQIRRWSERALDAGLDVATHAIGDAAVARTLDAYAELLAQRPGLAPGRLRIEHVSYVSEHDLERAATLGVVLSIQPNFVAPGPEGTTMEDERIGAAGAARVYAWGTLQRRGARLAFGSDYFTFPLAPLYTLHAAVTRADAGGLPAGGWHPAERLGREDSLRLMSTLVPPGGGAPHVHSLAAGEPADLVILSADPLTAERIPEIAVLGTLRAGRAVFAAPEFVPGFDSVVRY